MLGILSALIAFDPGLAQTVSKEGDLRIDGVDGQPLGANALRLIEALEFLGHPVPQATASALRIAVSQRDAAAVQALLDPLVLLAIDINPELRVRVSRGPAGAELYQHGFKPFLIKVHNEGVVTSRLRIFSPQAGALYAGAGLSSLNRQQQAELCMGENVRNEPGRFLQAEVFAGPPMGEHLSGLEVEYAIIVLSSSEAGRREANLGFTVGQSTQDIGFRGETSLLFDVKPAVPVQVSISDHDGTATVARLTIRDPQGRVHPSQIKRLAPDLFFQPQIYRSDGATLLLTPGRYEVTSGRGPEYREQRQWIEIPPEGKAKLDVHLQRWVDPARHGFYSGDHHIHAAGCSHYTLPSQGISPQDMFFQVKGEGLNVGCVLTWGPGFEYQKGFFSPRASQISEPFTVLKYDIEVSGFGSQALGHVCLLNLRDQIYPGAEDIRGWPTWTIPVLRWAKSQGGVTGFPHSDMEVDPRAYARRYLARNDHDGDGLLNQAETEVGLVPEAFAKMDLDRDARVSLAELAAAADRAANELPNLVLPSMRGVGAMEIFVAVTEGVCDFISAMNTGRVGEWNTWYHLMNSGFPVKVGGETDFPCMSGRQVGQGRTYVKLADSPIEAVDSKAWCRGLAEGRSYVSDGYAHAFSFSVGGKAPGMAPVGLDRPGNVQVRALVAFVPRVPRAVAHGTMDVVEGRRFVGDTRALHGPRSESSVQIDERRVEIVRNGLVVASCMVAADGAEHWLEFEVAVDRSSWIALRHFPQLHTNPVEVILAGKPIRASAESARWCAESVDLLWENRHTHISPDERPTARAAYDRAVAEFLKRADEAQ